MNCHNGEKYLRQSILSIINQTYKNGTNSLGQ